jgi:hypothetical protein
MELSYGLVLWELWVNGPYDLAFVASIHATIDSMKASNANHQAQLYHNISLEMCLAQSVRLQSSFTKIKDIKEQTCK